TQLNPMQRDLAVMKDDEILVSFEKLFGAVEPGGTLSVVLPDWATGLSDRLEELLPLTGFTLEKRGIVSRSSGKSENELRFRKPFVKSVSADGIRLDTEQASAAEIREPSEPRTEPEIEQSVNPPQSTISTIATEVPPVQGETEGIQWAEPKMTRLERSMLKVAIRIISERRQPVPYRELLNQVYMELVDHKIEFDSARQIETTLLHHNGRELLLLEDEEKNGLRAAKKWWLSSQEISSESSHGVPGLDRIREVGPKLRGIRKRFLKSRPRYNQQKDDETDSDTPPG
ncbi:MAG TPA: hypothetical protein VE955_00210, partial [Candidatus Dormibacteraeota bacterium]|nr:hypothetical protein [Candidatus Dormibacteraeota bacterium]